MQLRELCLIWHGTRDICRGENSFLCMHRGSAIGNESKSYWVVPPSQTLVLEVKELAIHGHR